MHDSGGGLSSDTRPIVHRLAIRFAIAGLLLAILVVPAMHLDGIALEVCDAANLPGDLRKVIYLSEAFAHGVGAAVILFTLWLATCGDTRRRVAIAAVITLACGLAGNLSKALFIRVRPYASREITVGEGWGIRIRSPVAPAANAREVPVSIRDARQRSFPSGHAATAWGLAIGLWLLAPRARVMFVLLASLASLQRLVADAHYLSDVIAGAAMAMIVGAAMLCVVAGQQWWARPSGAPATAADELT